MHSRSSFRKKLEYTHLCRHLYLPLPSGNPLMDGVCLTDEYVMCYPGRCTSIGGAELRGEARDRKMVQRLRQSGCETTGKVGLVARVAALLMFWALWAPVAHADVVIQVESVEIQPGATSGYIEVYCYNDTGQPLAISSYNLIVTTEAPIVVTTAPSLQYVPQIYTPVYSAGAYGAMPTDPSQVYGYETTMYGSATIDSGATAGLIRLPFEVSGTTTAGQSFDVTVTGVEIMGSSGQIPLDTITFNPGQVSVVPEPSTIVLLAGAAVFGTGLALVRRYRSRRRGRKVGSAPQPFFED